VDNGGSPVQSYELWVDDGNKGPFSQVTRYGQSEEFTIERTLENLVSGRFYRVKLRAENAIGISDFSDIVEIGLCDKPATILSITKVIELSSES
jgi:hypothetical protein